jgi:hypothetical protein
LKLSRNSAINIVYYYKRYLMETPHIQSEGKRGCIDVPIRVENRPQVAGIAILFAGVALLVFTFINAFLFLLEPLSIVASADLAQVFGEALAPLIQSCVRLMYLGIMGWIGSLLTVRGIPLLKQRHLTSIATVETQDEQRREPVIQTESSEPAESDLKEPSFSQEEPAAVLIPHENQREE